MLPPPPPPPPTEQIFGASKSVNYATNKLIKVRFSVADGRNPVGATAVYLQNANGGGYFTPSPSSIQPETTAGYYILEVNTGTLGVGSFLQVIKILSGNEQIIYSTVQDVTLGESY